MTQTQSEVEITKMEDKTKVYPVSEIFTNPQGEGEFSGTAMFFIRLAGCSVGKRFPKERYEGKNPLPMYVEMCTILDGRTMECDTNYRSKEKLTVKQIFERIPEGVEHVCITGGEPFNHNLVPLVMTAQKMNKKVHIETSGTVALDKAFPSENMSLPRNFTDALALGLPHTCHEDVWITVSPKFGFLSEMVERADEIKLLIDEKFDPVKLPVEIIQHHNVYIMAVNYEHSVNRHNMKLVMEWQKKVPAWKIGLQLHKVLQEFTGEKVL